MLLLLRMYESFMIRGGDEQLEEIGDREVEKGEGGIDSKIVEGEDKE